MQIELGMVLLLLIVNLGIQIRFFNVFETKLNALWAKRSAREAAQQEEDRAASRISQVVGRDKEKFEHRYSRIFPFAVPASEDLERAISAAETSPTLSQGSRLHTPKAEVASPLLPELSYVSAARRASMQAPRASAETAVSELSGSSDNLKSNTEAKVVLEQVAECVRGQSSDLDTAEELAKQIQDKEIALSDIVRRRKEVSRIRNSLGTSSLSESVAPSVTGDGKVSVRASLNMYSVGQLAKSELSDSRSTRPS